MNDSNDSFLDPASSGMMSDEEERSGGNSIEGRLEVAGLSGKWKRWNVLTREQVCTLVSRIAAGDQQAKDVMVLHNMGLVISIAKRFRWSSLPFPDLIQEGVPGLITAINRYDPGCGAMFSTYATWWIRQSIARAVLNTGLLVRVPIHTQELVNKVILCQQELLESGVMPTTSAIAQRLAITRKQVDKALLVLMTMTRQVSLEDAVPDYHGEAVVGDFISDTSIPNPTVVLEAKQELCCVRVEVERVLGYIEGTYGKRYRSLFLYHYGFDAGLEQRTLRETGKHFGVTRERASQILQKIWTQGSGGNKARIAFERMLAGVSYLEELSGFQLAWGSLQGGGVAESVTEFLTMFQSTAREALSREEFSVCASFYGFDEGYRLSTEEETAARLSISSGLVRRTVNHLWNLLRPYARHLTRSKVKRRMALPH